MIRDLENSECLELIKNIHGKTYFSKRLYCNGVVPLTPEKNALTSPDECETQNEASANSIRDSLLAELPVSQDRSDEHPDTILKSSLIVPSILSPIASDPWPIYERNELARRHSLSLLDRTPPKGSLAEELLSLDVRRPSRNKTIMTSIRDLTETLSEFNSGSEHPFNSCRSSMSGNEASDTGSSSVSGSKKKLKKRKRKTSSGKKELQKKGNFGASPETVLEKSN